MLSLFVLFVDMLHVDSVFQPDRADVVWDDRCASPAVSMRCASLPVIVTHCCSPCPSAYAASKCVVMVSRGCIRVCSVLA